jgi:hypothetical protein
VLVIRLRFSKLHELCGGDDRTLCVHFFCYVLVMLSLGIEIESVALSSELIFKIYRLLASSTNILDLIRSHNFCHFDCQMGFYQGRVNLNLNLETVE